jgi:hypothetical protein
VRPVNIAKRKKNSETSPVERRGNDRSDNR